jgi:hypothetical protein
MRTLMIAGLLCAASVTVAAPPEFDGRWETSVNNGCVGASVGKAARNCGGDDNAAGPDEFIVELVQREDVVCGFVSSSAMYGKRTDESIIVGTVHGGIATVEFESTWDNPSMRGIATLKIARAKLKWHVKRDIPDSYTWKSATATKVEWSPGDRTQWQVYCNSHWEEIHRGDTSHLTLHE